MQMVMTFMAVVAGMIFSLVIALLAEELIFGQIFRMFFTSSKLAQNKLAHDVARMQPVVARPTNRSV